MTARLDAAPAAAPARAAGLAASPPEPAWVRWLTAAGVVVCCAVVGWWLRPDLWVLDTTITGGDTGAHVWGPAFLRDHVYPNLRLAGWSFDWYSGFPVGQFYFPFPALLIVALDVVLPYNIAFKLVTVLGPVALPAAAYCFGRGIGARRPIPLTMAALALPFLAFTGHPSDKTISFNQHVMGGVLASNLAGEYSFSIALAAALAFLGALVWTIEHRRRAWLPALLFAIVITSHVVVALFASAAAVLFVVSRLLRDPWSKAALLGAVGLGLLTGSAFVGAGALVVAAGLTLVRTRTAFARTLGLPGAIAVVGALLTGAWSIPMVARFSYTTNMRYGKVTDYLDYLFPPYLWWVFALVLVAVCAALVTLRRSTLELFTLTTLAGLTFWRWPELHASNVRFLPFYYLGCFLLAGIGVGELCRMPAAVARELGLVRALRDAAQRARVAEVVDVPGAAEVAEVADVADVVDVVDDAEVHPAWRLVAPVLALAATVVVCVVATVGLDRSFLPAWIRWNYEGYERKPAYPEYRSLIDAMDALPPGRALWEKAVENGGDTLGYYGTDFALMLLPYWTDGRIASQEGLYFESAASTPYHFLTTQHVARNPSGAVRGLPYANPPLTGFHLGVQQMQAMGVRYYLAQTPEAQRLADADPDLELVATVPDRDQAPPKGWKIYEVRDAAEVAPLRYEPVVLTGVDQGDGWLDAAADWWEDPAQLDRPFAADGPADWERVAADELADAPRRELPDVEVSDVERGDDSLSFRVSRPGVPVVVRTSAYPNWVAEGAEGPWRLSPNLMVVVPTGTEVRLVFARSGVEWVGIGATLLGIAGLVALTRWPRRRGRGAPVAPPDRPAGEPLDPPARPGAAETADATMADL